MKRIYIFLNTIIAIYRSYDTKRFVILVYEYINTIISSRISNSFPRKFLSYSIFAPDSRSYFSQIVDIFFNRSYPIKPTQSKITIIDCGSNIGISALFFKWICPQSVIYCFEPNPESISLLRKNIKANNFDETIFVNEYAISSNEGRTQFSIEKQSKASTGATLNISNVLKDRVIINVNLKKLSSFINGSVDILKLDIEGSEGEVIEEIIQSGKINNIKEIVLEHHFDNVLFKYPLEKVISNLVSAGFDCKKISEKALNSKLKTVLLHATRRE